VSVWDDRKVSLLFSFSGESFLGVCLKVEFDQSLCFVVNVYSKCDLNGKKRLWNDLVMSKGGFGGESWCVVGDFNAVRDASERRG
jgi:hypothetical protein